ncbi:uncharacterized protein LOC143462248 isoform X2 [Clavelina lepadiformis]|uniref:Fibrous sheath-interacting protein 1 n=1 Tax=Clavelina lepadiformis TaxID=159417 RepID=A0ABP0GLF0_CLALP
MDITPGDFKDTFLLSNRSNSGSVRSFQSGSKPLSRGSIVSGSFELLSPDAKPVVEDIEDFNFDEEEVQSHANDCNQSAKVNSSNLSTKRFISSSLSSHSSSTVSECHNEETSNDRNAKDDSKENLKEFTAYDSQLSEAIKKMQKLDRILTKKIQREKEVKRQRMENQKLFHEEMAKIFIAKEGGTYPDVTSNTEKYLALLPPPQQLDVLLERNENTHDFEPIFPTQLHFNEEVHKTATKFRQTENQNEPKVQRSHSSSSLKGKDSKLGDFVNEKDKPSSAGSKRKADSVHSNDKKTDFIKRNIELAKDSGKYISMTEEEKQRLNELLKDIDEVDPDAPEEGDAFTKLAALPSGEGYTPEPEEMKKLEDIDDQLQTLVSPTVYRSISSTSHIFNHMHSRSSEIMDIGRKIAKSSVVETSSPTQRMQDIEDRLAKLDSKWQNEFDENGPHLSDYQLHRLLEECSRCTSPNSMTTSRFSDLGICENDEYFPLSPTQSQRTSSTLRADSTVGSTSSRTIDTSSESEDAISVRSLAPKLSRDALNKLLLDARSSLGLSSPRLSNHNNISSPESLQDQEQTSDFEERNDSSQL